MFELTMENEFLDLLASSPCAKTLEYIDFRINQFEGVPISVAVGLQPKFELTLMCKCDFCKGVFEDIIIKKYFPTVASLRKPSYKELELNKIFYQMIKVYPIIPHAHYCDVYPAMGFRYYSLHDHANIQNRMRQDDENMKRLPLLSGDDIKKLYHYYLHSMKRTYDYFILRFQNLRYLTINDLPTTIVQMDEHQRCNIPIFHATGYESNQLYELVDAESLFS